MAAATVRAKFAIVDVVRTMTVATAVASSLHRCQRTAVTVIASDIQVSTVYFETGLCIVIKQPQVPGDRVMAGLAVVLEFACVRIVPKVAADALGAGFSKYLGFMAGLALEVVMLSQEWESRQIMIE